MQDSRTASVGCQTELWCPLPEADHVSRVSVGVATDDIEVGVAVVHDHTYVSHTTPTRSDNIGLPPTGPFNAPPVSEPSIVGSPPTSDVEDNEDDPDYLQESFTTDTESEPDSNVSVLTPVDDIKYVAFKSNMLELFKICHWPGCGKCVVVGPNCKSYGFATVISTECVSVHKYCWESHPKINNTYAGNLIIPSGVFLTGGSYSSFTELCAKCCQYPNTHC